MFLSDTLVKFSAKWVTNGRNSYITSFILQTILQRYTPEELDALSDFRKSLDALLVYTGQWFTRFMELAVDKLASIGLQVVMILERHCVSLDSSCLMSFWSLQCVALMTYNWLTAINGGCGVTNFIIVVFVSCLCTACTMRVRFEWFSQWVGVQAENYDVLSCICFTC